MNATDLIYALAAAATAPVWLRKARGGWDERLARRFPDSLNASEPEPGKPRILLHAVSVGEVSALRTLVPVLAERARVVVSTTTDTGLARAHSLFDPTAAVVRFPLDFSGCVRRFLDRVRPDAVGLVELELWPNFVRACRTRGVPVCVINGRLSERSFRGYRRLGPFIRPAFRSLAFAAVQDEAYAARFCAMGVSAERCPVTGSMKWDNTPARAEPLVRADLAPGSPAMRLLAELGVDPARPVVVAGSTGPGEEELLDRACREAGEVQLVCAPRKPERFDEAAAAMPGCVRRSLGNREPANGRAPDRFLLDTIGELSALYEAADVVVLGRSFFGLYGSDPTEPAGLGKPVVIGPFVSDFSQQVEALEGAGGLTRARPETVAGVLANLLGDADVRRRMGERALACIREQRGASGRHAELLLGLVGVQAGAAGEADTSVAVT